MIERPREDEEKPEINQEGLAEDFSGFDVLLRKTFWLILKSLIVPPQRIMTEWLTQHADNHLQYYKSLEIKLKRFFTDEFLTNAKEIFASLDSQTLLSDSQVRVLVTVTEPRIYQFFETNPDFFIALNHEFHRENAQLLLFAQDFMEYLGAITNGNLIVVESYFSTLDKDLRDTLWKTFSAPFNDETRRHAADWINDGFGKKFNEYAESFNASLKEFLQGKMGEYKKSLYAISRHSTKDPEERIYQFFANNFEMFLFIQTELDKPGSTLMQILGEYFEFLSIPVNSPLYTLRHEYDLKYPEKALKDDKDTSRLRNLGIFANQSDFARVINVRSVGLDGCLFHSAYYSSYRTDKITALINTNKSFFDHLKDSIQDDYKEIIFINGSLRQSYPADEFCCVLRVEGGVIMSESCFSALQSIVSHTMLSTGKFCRLEQYLLADTFNNLSEGLTTREALKTMANSRYQSKILSRQCVNDKSKIILLYAQIHKIAVNYKNDIVQFDFYSGDLDELRSIDNFFINNRDLKPRNVFLNLYHYNPLSPFTANAVELKFRIDDYQSGNIDFDYKANLKIMLECCNFENYAEPHLSPTDEKIHSQFAKPKNFHFVTDMPATVTLVANLKFNAQSFRQLRVSANNKPIAQTGHEEQKPPSIPLARLR